MSNSHQAIKIVTMRTGLSAHVIRVWEKRYGAVTPTRTGTNRRLYSDEEVERLGLLRELTQSGHGIGQVAKLPTEKLREMASQSTAAASNPEPVKSTTSDATILEECLTAVKAFDREKLESTFKRSTIILGAQGFLQRVVAPLAQRLGELWQAGTLTAAHEHFASVVIRVFLSNASQPFAGTEQSPVLLVATPAGQLHELGALLAGATATNLGWRVTYLGASLPAIEIAGAAMRSRARAVALSLVYPEDDPKLPGELINLREALPKELPLLVGGRAAPSYAITLGKLLAIQFSDLNSFGAELARLRRGTGETQL